MSHLRRALPSWIFVGALFVLAGVLGVLQYRWIGEVSRAERDRLRESLQLSLEDLSRGFDAEIAAALRSVMPADDGSGAAALEAEVSQRYGQWKAGTGHGRLFSRVAIAAPGGATLRMLDLATGTFRNAAWPSDWPLMRERMGGFLADRREGRGPPWPPGFADDGLVLEIPVVPPVQPGARLDFERSATTWLIFELDGDYLRGVLLPQLIRRYLGSNGLLDYQVEVVSNREPVSVIYRSDANLSRRIEATADADTGLFEVTLFMMRERGPRRPEVGMEAGRAPGPPMGGRWGGPGAPARWRMFVRHRAGSLEVVVEQARRRNLAVTAGVLLLMMAAVAALIRFTRRAQRLAGLEMDFVAGVSHELRTPLAVIHTAAYNLRGRVSNNPAQVEKYGALIQKESSRLKELVEQVLQFAGAKAGRAIREAEGLSVEAVIDEAIEGSQSVIEEAHCQVEKGVDPGLPAIMGDRVALRHAIENLVSNAAKYGSKDHRWIGIFARLAGNGDGPGTGVEIRVADRGPGIPRAEQEHVFDAFYRGRKAIEDQVHGTGLGLNLAKRIVEAHGGSIGVKSEPGKGTEVIVRLPAAPAGRVS